MCVLQAWKHGSLGKRDIKRENTTSERKALQRGMRIMKEGSMPNRLGRDMEEEKDLESARKG